MTSRDAGKVKFCELLTPDRVFGKEKRAEPQGARRNTGGTTQRRRQMRLC